MKQPSLRTFQVISTSLLIWSSIKSTDQLNIPQIIALSPQACTVTTRHGGCITSSTSLLTLITLEQCKSGLIRPHDLLPFFMPPSKLRPFFQVASVISGFLKASELFSPNPLSSLHIVHVEMLLLSILTIALSSTVVVFLWFDFTKRLSDHQSLSIRIFYQPHLFLKDDGYPLSFLALFSTQL